MSTRRPTAGEAWQMSLISYQPRPARTMPTRHCLACPLASEQNNMRPGRATRPGKASYEIRRNIMYDLRRSFAYYPLGRYRGLKVLFPLLAPVLTMLIGCTSVQAQ